MAESSGDYAGAGVSIVAALASFGVLAGLAARVIPLVIALPLLIAAVLLLAARSIAISRAVAAAHADAAALRAVFAASGGVLRTLNVTRVLRATAEAGAHLSAHAAAALVYVLDDGGRPVLKSIWGLDGPMPEQAELPLLGASVAEVVSTRKPVTVALPGGAGAPRGACLLPLQGGAGIVGVLALLSHKSPATFRSELSMLEYFSRQTALAIDNAHLYGQVQDMFISSITALAAAVDVKDAYTRGHSEDIAELGMMIATELGLASQEVEKVRLAGLLHDVGKIGVPDAILRKPGALDPAERAVMMTHATLGASIIDKPGPLQELVAIVRHHHERYDGHGYPDGLRGSEIPLGSAILAVADAFDAMTSHRAYRVARPVADTLEELRQHAGTQLHPQVVDALVRVVTREHDKGSPWFAELQTRTSSPNPAPADPPKPDQPEASVAWSLTQQVRDASSLPQMLTALVAATAKASSCPRCAVLLLDERALTLSVEASTSDALAPGRVFPRGRTPLWEAAIQRAAHRTADHVVYMPLVSGGQAVGILVAEHADDHAEQTLAAIAEVTAPVVHAALLRARAERSEASDDLTGLLNRRALVARLHQEVARHQRYGTRFALLLVDIIGLAQFNAQHGYDAGDDLIRRTAELLAANIRQVDSPARLSGGTLGVLMPELDRPEVAGALRRLQAIATDREVAIQGRFRRTQPLRWAIATSPEDGVDANALLAAAERRLRAEPEPSHP